MLRDAYPFLFALALLAVVAAVAGQFYHSGFFFLSLIFILLGLFIAYFFRNPEREIVTDPRLVLSPADGHVSVVKPMDANDPAAGNVVSVFLSVFDVHVNRTPIAGRIRTSDISRANS